MKLEQKLKWLTLNYMKTTRKLCYRKDDRAMHAI